MNNKRLSKLIKISILSAMGLLLMFIEFPLPIFPEFLKIDFSDVPAILGTFALGPFAGMLIELLKNLLHLLLLSKTGGIGELANFIVGAAFVMSAGFVYKRNKSRVGALIALFVGIVVSSIVASIGNYYVFLPLYESVLGFPMEAIVGMGKAINPSIKDLNTFIAYSILPFNLLKGLIISLITFLSYKKLSPILHK